MLQCHDDELHHLQAERRLGTHRPCQRRIAGITHHSVTVIPVYPHSATHHRVVKKAGQKLPLDHLVHVHLLDQRLYRSAKPKPSRVCRHLPISQRDHHGFHEFKKLRRPSIAGFMFVLGTGWVLATSHSSIMQGSALHDDYELETGVTFSITCGISLYLITLISKRLNDLGQPLRKIQARRSLFAFLVCATIGLLDGALVTIVSEAPPLAALTVIFLVLMQSALVLSIRAIGRYVVTMGIAGTAVYTLIAQVAFFQQSADSLMVITIAGNAVGLILISFVQTKSNLTCQR